MWTLLAVIGGLTLFVLAVLALTAILSSPREED
jgi:hypothetical protein